MSVDPQWNEVREDWLPGDGLRDINFPDAYSEAGGVENAEWQKLVDWIRSRSEWTASYAEDGEAVGMPDDVAVVMARSPTVSTLWRIDIGRGVIVNTHFAPGEIEFDVDPREVRGQKEFALVCDFRSLDWGSCREACRSQRRRLQRPADDELRPKKRRLGPAFPDTDWSPDGQKIVFTTWGGDRRGPSSTNPSDIYITNADGSGRQRLTSDLSFDINPAWSPDGRKIAFVSGRGSDRHAGLFIMNADGSEQRLLMRGGLSYPPFAWSPNGEKLAFTINLTSGPDGNSEIYVMNADGSGQRRLTRSTVRDNYPVWSPDGQKIAFESNWQIWVMNADGSGQDG